MTPFSVIVEQDPVGAPPIFAPPNWCPVRVTDLHWWAKGESGGTAIDAVENYPPDVMLIDVLVALNMSGI